MNEHFTDGNITAISCRVYGEGLHKTAVLDTQVFEKLKDSKWGIDKAGYLTATIGGKRKHLHRYIMSKKTGLIIDHINKNKLDNRVKNLRHANKRGNSFNTNLMVTNSSGKTGVYFSKGRGEYIANISLLGKTLYLGSYKTKAEAVAARIGAEKLINKINPSMLFGL